MNRFAFFLCLCVCLNSCKSKKGVVTKRTRSTRTVSSTEPRFTKHTSKSISRIIKNAQSFEGTRYKYGGTTKRGMDCSGLIYTSFLKEDIKMPRTTGALSKYGNWVDVKELQEGDLVFFATRKNSRKVNHVGQREKTVER